MSNSERWDRQLFRHYGPAVAYVEVESSDGDRGIGTAFHVGGGIYVTARHVVEGQTIIGINHVVEFPIEQWSGFEKRLDEVGTTQADVSCHARARLSTRTRESMLPALLFFGILRLK